MLILQEIQNDLRKQNVEPEKFRDRIIFVSMFNETTSKTLEGKWNYSRPGGGAIQRYRSSSIQEYQCFESWDPEKENNRDTIHFNAGASNTELFFRIIHSVNQLSIYGAVSSWCEQIGLTEEERELARPFARKESVTKDVLSCVKSKVVKLLVSFHNQYLEAVCGKTFRTSNHLSETIRLQGYAKTMFFASSFISAGIQGYKTRPDEDDGFGKIIPFCREYTFLE